MRNSKLYWINVYIKTENIHYILSVSYHRGTHTVGSSLFEGEVVVVEGGGQYGLTATTSHIGNHFSWRPALKPYNRPFLAQHMVQKWQR